ncbi:hypothetical protein ABT340_39565 [Streptosporangium sp. NPDC000239]|uniref:hypothetical protein n=1 Tax=Streptosporangium sp. NPDC000239 TaxID=3154248 RepID=UPI0033299720
MEQFPRGGTEYLTVIITGDASLDTLPVHMQVLPYGVRPTTDGWQPAEWDTDDDGNTIAKILIGPDSLFDFSLAPGTKVPWVKVTTSQETPVLEGTPFEVT